jgi:regulator of protease activity HflC (stomatin/prohibitin superfamily)
MSSLISLTIITVVLFLILLILVASAIKIVQEHQRGVLFRLGHFIGVRGPGLVLTLPAIDKALLVDMRETKLELPRQQAMTQDRHQVKASAIIRYRITAPDKAILNVANYQESLAEAARLVLDDLIAQHSFDDLFLQRRDIAALLQDILQEQATPWGLEITALELKDIGSA